MLSEQFEIAQLKGIEFRVSVSILMIYAYSALIKLKFGPMLKSQFRASICCFFAHSCKGLRDDLQEISDCSVEGRRI